MLLCVALQLLQDFPIAIVINNWGMKNQNFALLMGFTFHRNWLKNVMIFNSLDDMISDHWTRISFFPLSLVNGGIIQEDKKLLFFFSHQMVSRILFSRILNFFLSFGAYFDLFKTNVCLRIKRNQQEKK